MRKEDKMTDRERILINIAAFLAQELNHLQMLPAVEAYMRNSHSLCCIVTESGYAHNLAYKKGDIVVCQSSVGRQQSPWLVSFVEGPHERGDQSGLLLRAIGSGRLCNWSNESFMRINGISERFLWEGDKRRIEVKIHKALNKIFDNWHRFRGLEFPEEGKALVYIGPHIWIQEGKKPYVITLKYDRKTTIKTVIEQMQAQGYGTREFDPDDGTYTGPMQGCMTIKRDDLVKTLEASGIKLKAVEGEA